MPVSDTEGGSLDVRLSLDAGEVNGDPVPASDDVRGAYLVPDGVRVDNMAAVGLQNHTSKYCYSDVSDRTETTL